MDSTCSKTHICFFLVIFGLEIAGIFLFLFFLFVAFWYTIRAFTMKVLINKCIANLPFDDLLWHTILSDTPQIYFFVFHSGECPFM